MKCWVKSGSDFNELYMYATSDAETYKADISYNDGQWHEITLNGIIVKGGQLEVGFYCDGAAGCWARIDDVTLVRIADLSSSVSSMPASQQSVRQPFFSATGAASSMPHSGLNIVRVVENGVTKTKKFWN